MPTETVNAGYECVMPHTKNQSKATMIPHTITGIQPLDRFSVTCGALNLLYAMHAASNAATSVVNLKHSTRVAP